MADELASPRQGKGVRSSDLTPYCHGGLAERGVRSEDLTPSLASAWSVVGRALVAAVLAGQGLGFAAGTAPAASTPADAAAPIPAASAPATQATATSSVAPAVASTAAAPRAVPTAADPALEARMLAITSELRCLVCQNQTIADSHADLAVDLRAEVREMLRAGRSPDEIRRYMTDRYGDFVLYRPPMKPTTLLLWLGPALLLVVGGAALVVALRRRSRLGDDRFEPDPALDEPEAEAPVDPAVRPGAPA
jgi:cytochrome c-type biogenesis protein CcmH